MCIRDSGESDDEGGVRGGRAVNPRDALPHIGPSEQEVLQQAIQNANQAVHDEWNNLQQLQGQYNHTAGLLDNAAGQLEGTEQEIQRIQHELAFYQGFADANDQAHYDPDDLAQTIQELNDELNDETGTRHGLIGHLAQLQTQLNHLETYVQNAQQTYQQTQQQLQQAQQAYQQWLNNQPMAPNNGAGLHGGALTAKERKEWEAIQKALAEIRDALKAIQPPGKKASQLTPDEREAVHHLKQLKGQLQPRYDELFSKESAPPDETDDLPRLPRSVEETEEAPRDLGAPHMKLSFKGKGMRGGADNVLGYAGNYTNPDPAPVSYTHLRAHETLS
jgi:tetratricopeptide (TPR) repeat protein